jgi:coproporphyrinogen III oxidase-like Fe-S oxidoreductase
MVSRSAFKNFANYVISHVGRMKASWVANAIKIAQRKLQGEQYSAPEWIARHINGNTTPKSICNLEGLNGKDYQTLTIGSSSIGNSRQVENVQRAVKARERKVSERLKLVLSGYSKDVAKGIRIKRHSHDS